MDFLPDIVTALVPLLGAGMPVVADSYINADSLVYQNLEGASSSNTSAEE